MWFGVRASRAAEALSAFPPKQESKLPHRRGCYGLGFISPRGSHNSGCGVALGEGGDVRGPEVQGQPQPPKELIKATHKS